MDDIRKWAEPTQNLSVKMENPTDPMIILAIPLLILLSFVMSLTLWLLVK